MDIKQTLLQCLKEESLGLSKAEIEQILNEEMNKPEAEIDCEIIDMCVELLAQQDGVELPAGTSVPPVALPVTRRKWLPRKVLLIAATVAALVTLAAMGVGAQPRKFESDYYAVTVFSDHVEVINKLPSVSPPQEEPFELTAFREELAANGLEDIWLPDAFLKEAERGEISYRFSEYSKYASAFFRIGEDEICFSVNESDIFTYVRVPIHYTGQLRDRHEIHVGDLAVQVWDLTERRVLYFVDGNRRYDILTSLDMDTALRIAESLQQ